MFIHVLPILIDELLRQDEAPQELVGALLTTPSAEALRQLERNEAKIMFDPNSETIDIVLGPRVRSVGTRE